MNKNRYRVIYSHVRLMFVAVAETVKSRTKAAGQSSGLGTDQSSHFTSNSYKKLNPVNFAVVEGEVSDSTQHLLIAAQIIHAIILRQAVL